MPLELPDDIARRVKAAALARGVRPEELVIEAVEAKLTSVEADGGDNPFASIAGELRAMAFDGSLRSEIDRANDELRVISTDNASNVTTSATVTVTIDRIAPGTPSTPTLAPASDSGVAGDNRTRITTPTFTGTAEAGITVRIFDGPAQVGSGTAAGGSYSITTSTLSNGAHSITAAAVDTAGNQSPSSSGLAVTIDTTAPVPSSVTLANGGVSAKIDTGDSVTIRYSEQLMASSLCSVWTSESTTQSLSNVTVTVADSGGSDSATVTTPSCTFRLGTIVLGDYLGGGPATFTSSAVNWDPSTFRLTITLGALATSNSIKTGVNPFAARYTPVTNITDLAGNAMVATQFTNPTSSGF